MKSALSRRNRILAICSAFLVLTCASIFGEEYAAKPPDEFFAKYKVAKAPPAGPLLLSRGDRLAICGDSITEQQMYSRIMETYLTVCAPEMKIQVRQYGWGGETAPGFLARMTSDCLRFRPTVATTCYGMNDHGYRLFEPAIGAKYVDASRAILRSFRSDEVKVVQGSPGCVGPFVPWAKGTAEEMNLNLCELRNLGLQLAQEERVRFADVFWPMLTASYFATQQHGTNFAVPGKDGVHPDWAGHVIMAHAFLKSFGLDGDLGEISLEFLQKKAKTTKGHRVEGVQGAPKRVEITVESRQYPFCAAGDPTRDNTIRAGMQLVPFNQDLNRLMLVVREGDAKAYKVTWGTTVRTFAAEVLAKGINLAEEFEVNPFSEPFAKVDEAVRAKQEYETRQVKTLFHGPEGKTDMEGTVTLTEKVRTSLAQAIEKAFVPVKHTLVVEAE